MNLRGPREVGIETLEDFDTGKFYSFDQRTGESQRCNAKGEPIARFQTDFSGVAPTKERVRRGMTVPVLERGTENIPKYIGRPAKYVGFVSLPRPGLDMNARGKQCAFTLPEYLHPIPPKLGRVSTSSKAKTQKKIRKVSSLPTFMETLDSQYHETLSLNAFTDDTKPLFIDNAPDNRQMECLGEFKKIRSAGDLGAYTARNRQKHIEAIERELEALKPKEEKISMKGHFGVTRPPFNPQEIKQIETERDRLAFPEKWRKHDDRLKADKAGVRKRRRERYPEHFAKLDEQERAQEAAQARNTGSGDTTMLPSDVKGE